MSSRAAAPAKLPGNESLQAHDLFVALDVMERKGVGQARATTQVASLIPIEEEWLFDLEPSPLEEKESVAWDKDRRQVVALSQIRCGQLILSETKKDPTPSAETTGLLLKESLGLVPARLPLMKCFEWIEALARFAPKEELESAIARVELASQHAPKGKTLPRPTETTLYSILAHLLLGKSRATDLEAVDWPDLLLSALAGAERRWIEQAVPSHLELLRGRRTVIHYELTRSPWIASRLQDFFGMKTGPAILSGRVPLTLHLLAPNQRAVQVTSDLQGFWQRDYPKVRKELSRKYPRHQWPENPL